MHYNINFLFTFAKYCQFNRCFHMGRFGKQILMIKWCLTTPFSIVFRLHHGDQCTYPCFHGFHLTSSPHNSTIFFPSHWLLSHITIVETTDSGEKGMNPVAMIILSLRKRIMAEPGIEPATPCSQARNATD